MALSPAQATDALRDIADTENRSSRAYAYQRVSPHLILWGALWSVGYGLTDALPHRANATWFSIVAIGLATDVLIELRGSARAAARHDRPVDPTRKYAASRSLVFVGLAFTTFAFVAATLAVMSPVSGKQIGAFIPLVVAAGYGLAGIWTGLRFLVAGAAIAALTLAGFFLLPAHFALWMAGAGGGALVFAGLWFRKV